MIRKPPLRTYQKKGSVQTSFSYSQAPSWAPHSYSNEKLLTNNPKSKPASTSDEKYIEELSSDYLETTFDKIAKDARLPTPPSPISCSSVNISSDVTNKIPSPDNTEVCEFPLRQEVPKGRTNRRPKRKPTHSRLVSEDTEVVVKKRLKHDLINISTKKAKAVRSSKRKLCSNKNGKSLVDNKQKRKIPLPYDSSSTNVKASPTTRCNKNSINKKKQEMSYCIRRKKNIRKISSSSSENSILADCSGEVYNLKPKSKAKCVREHNAGSRKLKVSTCVDALSSKKSDSLKIKENCSVDRERAPENNDSALVEIRYAAKTHKVENIPRRITRNNVQNNFNSNYQPACSKTSKQDEFNKENLLIKPCSIVLLKYNENNNPLVNSRKKSTTFLPYSTVHSVEDIFQSSISKMVSNIGPESHNPVEISSHESKEKKETQSVKNGSDLFHNLDISGIKDCVVKISDCQTNKIYDRNKKHDANRSLHYLKCSTPINAYVTIDRSMNRLSPISVRNEQQIYLKNNKFSSENSINKPLLMISNAEFAGSTKEYFNIPKNNLRKRSSRRKLSISYEEDVSFEKSCEYYEKNEVKKTPPKNIGSRQVAVRNINPEQMKSPTSQIQKSLEFLEIDLESPNNRCAANVNDKRRLPQKGISTSSIDTDRSISVTEKTNKYGNMSEFTIESKDSCSQPTPVGIITTRSGRQLKLTVTAEKKFFNDSNDPQIQFDVPKIANDSNLDSNYEIIENSQKMNNQVAKSTRFSVLKSHNICDSPDGVKRLNFTDMSVEYVDVSTNVKPVTCKSKVQVSNDSMSYESLNVNAKSNLRKESPDGSNECTISNRESGSIIDNNVSALSNEQIDMSVSVSNDKKMLQSIINCTINIDSLSIRSHANEKSKYPSSSNNSDDSNNEEWTPQSSSGYDDSVPTDVQEMMKGDSKSENQVCSNNDDGDGDADWSTITSYESNNDTTSDVDESIKNQPMENDKLTDQSSNSNTDLSTPNENQSDNERLSKTTNEEPKSASDQSLEWSEVNQRIKLLPLRITTRRRRRTFLKLDTKDIEPVIKEQSSIQSRKDDHEIKSRVNPCETLENTDLFKHPSDLNLRKDLQPIVLLEKLKDPVKLTTNQKQSCGLKLTAIHEQPEKSLQEMTKSSNESSTLNDNKLDEACHEFRRPDILHSLKKESKINNTSFKADVTTTALDSNHDIEKLNASELESLRKQSLFLKPGKEWARSLSILNNIQNGLDLEVLCTGKGKNWRNSVQSILDMQQERVVESCLRKNEDNKEAQPYYGGSITNRTACLEDQSIGSASPSRFIRRMSIRVVPDNKRISHIEDTSFLEAYGISTSKNRKTLSTSSKLKSNRETLIYNERCEDVGIEPVEYEHITTARDVVLQRCCQEDYLPFIECFPDEYLERCRKIGEGVYGEVFLYENGKEKSVIKIIPIEGNALVNGERQKRFDEILSEIVTAKELHNLRYGENCQTDGFVEVKNIRCIHGKYPEKLIELWKAYDDDKGSDNDCPSMFHKDQLYIVLELGHGGQDLEAFVFQSAVESHAIFVQAALALAVAEQSLEFEHRDLHWGNILISYTKNSRVTYKLNDKEYSYPSKGMQVAIIDFTLSRMSYEGCCIFNDLALDPALFTAQGEYQFEVYRLMRDKIGNNWQTFEPYTNILWLHYILDKMITALRYKRKTTKAHRDAIFQLQELKEVVLDYDSAFDFITNCDKITRLQYKRATTVKSTQVQSNELDLQKR